MGPRKPPARMSIAPGQSAPPREAPLVEASAAANGKIEGNGFRVPGAVEVDGQRADQLVRAYFDPFFEKWYKIPDGYEAPAGMDLTAWHNKRTDPVEWQRLHAEGRLSQIIPR